MWVSGNEIIFLCLRSVIKAVILRTNKTVGFGGTLGHIIRLLPLFVRLVHSEDYAVKNFLLSCLMHVQSGFGYSKAIGGVVH